MALVAESARASAVDLEYPDGFRTETISSDEEWRPGVYLRKLPPKIEIQAGKRMRALRPSSR
jgi:hypothetical protein